jgi:hypothetical protein
MKAEVPDSATWRLCLSEHLDANQWQEGSMKVTRAGQAVKQGLLRSVPDDAVAAHCCCRSVNLVDA